MLLCYMSSSQLQPTYTFGRKSIHGGFTVKEIIERSLQLELT